MGNMKSKECTSLTNMEATSKEHRDWSSLPSDVVSIIANMLPIPQRILMRNVCLSWCLAISAQSLPSPWLILPGVGDDTESRTRSCTFFSVAANQSFGSGSLPALEGKRCVGSNAGWLVMADDYSLDFKEWNNRNDFSRHTIYSMDPITLKHRCLDVYGLTNVGLVKVFDFTAVGLKSTPCIKVFSNGPEKAKLLQHMNLMRYFRGNFAFSVSGDLLFLLREMETKDFSNVNVMFGTKKFIVLRYNPHNSDMDLVDDLGGQSLFIGNNNAMSISCKNLPGLKNNCIYFTDSFYANCAQIDYLMQNDVGVFDLETQSCKSCASSDTVLKWPPSVWIQPRF